MLWISQRRVQMTTEADTRLLLRVALDMTSSLPVRDRAQRLAETIHRALPCDAVCILRLDGDELLPIASVGLAPDLLGHRFRRGEQPRLDILCGADGPTRFAADSQLHDPYDGFVGSLVEGEPTLSHRVHSCLGCPLRIEDRLVGLLTLDALAPDRFDGLDDQFLSALAALTAAALRTGELIEALERSAVRHGLAARELVRDELERQGGMLIGNSAPMARLRDEMQLIARSHFPVLVTGETGVGKELVVRTLHAQSARRDQVLVYVNCAALPESIVESELFGHSKGAFTGAAANRLGKFQVADGACLFLDEVGELPLHVQPKLLRALQEGEVQSVGSDRPTKVDVRVFAATNRDLHREVVAGRFRADLLYRLDVCRLHVPPLREHRDDLAIVAGHFCDALRRQLGTGSIRVGAAALRVLDGYAWPGNVRELRNVISRAVLRAVARSGPGQAIVLGPADIGPLGEVGPWPASVGEPVPAPTPFGLPEPVGPVAEPASLRDAVRDLQRRMIDEALLASGGNLAAAARRLGMDRSNLHHLRRRLGMR